jgi:hypothetical protein
MSETLPFWQEVRHSLMVRGDGWKPVVETLADHINLAEIKDLLQSHDQLTYLNGVGHIAGVRVDTQLDRDIVRPFLSKNDMTLESVALQWLYRFFIVEALVEHNRAKPMTEWEPMFLHMIEQGLQFLVVTAAILCLIEESAINAEDALPGDTAESIIKERVAKACEFLHPKSQDYGESFRRHGLPGLLPRLWDKIARYAQLKADNRPGHFEKKEDSTRDLLGYSCIAYSLMLELPTEFRKSYQPTSEYVTESNVMEGAEWKKTK